MGLAKRAGKVITGAETVILGVKIGRIKIVFLASDVHDNTLEKVQRATKQANIPLMMTFSGAELSHAIGSERKVLGITDYGFSQALIKKMNEGVWLDDKSQNLWNCQAIRYW